MKRTVPRSGNPKAGGTQKQYIVSLGRNEIKVRKANPSLGITVGIDKVQAACDSAKQNPGEENAFRQLRLNQWVKQAVRWMPMEKWYSHPWMRMTSLRFFLISGFRKIHWNCESKRSRAI